MQTAKLKWTREFSAGQFLGRVEGAEISEPDGFIKLACHHVIELDIMKRVRAELTPFNGALPTWGAGSKKVRVPCPTCKTDRWFAVFAQRDRKRIEAERRTDQEKALNRAGFNADLEGAVNGAMDTLNRLGIAFDPGVVRDSTATFLVLTRKMEEETRN